MNFVIITHVPHISKNNSYYGYSPYIREMNLWLQNVDRVTVVAPAASENLSAIHAAYDHMDVDFVEVKAFSLTSAMETLRTVFYLPGIIFSVYKAMKQADHIHLRCPGNIGLLGCLVQIAFPSKTKTAKYAGNWDPKSRQPWTYKLQKWILENTFLTKNIHVLVYGEWEERTKNLKPFFTATYREADKKTFDFIQDNRETELESGTICFLFVGTLSEGKRPLYAIKLVEQLHMKGYKVQLELFGDGKEREVLTDYIQKNKLAEIIILKGNQTVETVKSFYQKRHFLILPSKSEGWPKVVAEAMFWGCLPIATPVSCVSNMLKDEERGILLSLDLQKDIEKIENLIINPDEYKSRTTAAIEWSQGYTVEKFEQEITKLLVN